MGITKCLSDLNEMKDSIKQLRKAKKNVELYQSQVIEKLRDMRSMTYIEVPRLKLEKQAKVLEKYLEDKRTFNSLDYLHPETNDMIARAAENR